MTARFVCPCDSPDSRLHPDGYCESGRPLAPDERIAKDVAKKLGLCHSRYCFVCPYCDREFERGGGKEGFVKSGANNHVWSCWELALFIRGYWITRGPTMKRGTVVAPIDRAKSPRDYRRLRALLAARKRAGADVERIRKVSEP